MFVMITHFPSTRVEVSLHTECDGAVTAAKRQAIDMCEDDSYTECTTIRCLFHAVFSHAGGYCYVVEKEVN